jgi:hypothetical protein
MQGPVLTIVLAAWESEGVTVVAGQSKLRAKGSDVVGRQIYGPRCLWWLSFLKLKEHSAVRQQDDDTNAGCYRVP